MMKENKQIKKDEKYFTAPKIVNRKNYHLILSEFNEILAKPERKFLFLNIDFSNLKIFTQRNIKLDNYLIDYIQELNLLKSKNQNETQIIYTEFLICKQSKKTSTKLKFYSFLIPSMKFHKFNQQESFIKIDPDCLKYFYLNKPIYQFSKICQVDSISYLSLLEKEKIDVNLTKILSKGKPTKKENTKSYYFFPKNIIIPTKEKQNELVSIIKESYNEIKEIKNSTETNKDEYAIKTIVIKDNYVAERLIHFDWRLLANQLDKNVVRGEIDRCSIGRKAQNNFIESENSNSKIIFLNFCHELADYIKEIRKNINNFSKSNAGNFPNFILNSPNEINPLIKKIIYNWKNFIELYFSDKVSINLILSETENRKVEFEFKLTKTSERIESELAGFEIFIISLNKFFLNDNSDEANLLEESNIYKNQNLTNFDILSLFPHEIIESLEITYFLNILINLKSLKDINLDRDTSTKFTFDDLFLNMNNEKEILFDYDLETELYKFVTALGKIVSCKIEGSSRNIFHFDKKEFFKDFLIISKCKVNSMTEIFDNYLINFRLSEEKRELNFSYNHKDINKLMEFLKSFKENEKNFKYKLMEIFHQSKIEMITEEEFGLSNFLKFLFDAEKIEKSHLTIVAPNLLHKLLIIFIEFFSDYNGIDLECFLKFFAQPNLNFIDLNYLTKKSGLKLIKELSYIKNDLLFANNNIVINADYITQKNFLVFAKFINQLKIANEDPFDSRILFEEQNLNENRNKFFVNNVIKSNSADEIHVLTKTGELIKEKLQGNSDDNEKKLYLSKTKHNSMEEIIGRCKDYGNFMINVLDDLIEVQFINLEKSLEELKIFFN